MSDRATLRTTLEQTAQRVGDTLPPWESFIDRANVQIGRDIRLPENVKRQQTINPPHNLPTDFREMILVEAQMGGTWQPVRPAGGNEVSRAQRNSYAYPLWYWVEGQTLRLAPPQDASVRITFYARPVLGSAGADTNSVLAQYLQLYLSGAMIFFAEWSQDETLLAYWREAYNAEYQALNEAATQERQPVSSSDYSYAGGTFAT